MKFDGGPSDRLFGKRVTLGFRTHDGKPGTREVTEQWLDDQLKAGKLTPIEGLVQVHIADPFRGCYVDYWKIGEQIRQETVDRRLDPETQALYAIVVYKAGQPETFLCDVATWKEAEMKLKGV